MLPISHFDDPASTASRVAGTGQPLFELLTRMSSFRHMDFEYAFWLMANLCTSPRTAFRTTLYHSRTKHQWARDDPAFVVVLLYLLLVTAIAWSLAFAQRTPLQVFALYLYVAVVDFLLLGAVLSTAGWWFSNNYLRHSRGVPAHEWVSSAVDRDTKESVEWLYAFDVHCNAFLPLYLLLYVLHYLLLPLLLQPGFLPALLSNSLFAAAFSIYHYLTFLGYSELPFLHRCECFVYPIALVLLAFILSLPLSINCTATVAYIYAASDEIGGS